MTTAQREHWAKRLVTIKEAAEHIGKTPSWMYDNWRKERIPAYRIGGQLRFRILELDTWIEKQREAA